MIFVFPHCQKHETEIRKIPAISRLFAYPGKPHFENKGDLVIIDSGAYALGRYGGAMTAEYKRRLSEHYNEFSSNSDVKNIMCVAPDVYMNPEQSMYNFLQWHKKGYYKNVVPVLQSDCHVYKKEVMLQQADFYLNYTDKLFYANSRVFSGEQANCLNLDELFMELKRRGVKWIHMLGAGWSLEDIKNWNKLRYLDSADSTNYYASKNRAELFCSENPVDNIKSVLEVLKNEK